MKFKIALAQIDPVLGDLKANVEKHLAFGERAEKEGAGLVVFPELSLTGYSIKDMNWELAIDPAKPPAEFRGLLEMSKRVSIIAGAVEEGSDFGIYNSAFLFEGGAVKSVHRKIYPPTYGMFEEMRYFSRGSSVRAFDSTVGRVGVLVCEDMWHISLPYVLAMDDARVIVSLTASPLRMGDEKGKLESAEINTENQKAYARLLSCYVAFCNRVGFEDGVNFWGGSHLAGPDGSVVATAKLFEEDLLVVDVDDDEIRRARRFSRHFLDEEPATVARELARLIR